MADNRDVEINVAMNDRTGPGAASVKRNVRSVKDEAERVTRDIGKLPIGEVGTSLGANLASGLVKGLGPVSTYAAPLLVGIGLAAAPGIGASIAGAVIGGAGIGGVLGGILIASKDTRVQSAFASMGKSLQNRLDSAAGSFVKPVISGIQTIQQAIDTIDLESIFKTSSQFVEPLANGIGKAITSIGDGLEDLVANAGPVIDAISEGIAGLGESIGEGLSSLADNGEGAADALRVLFAIISIGIEGAFKLVNALTELYEINKAIGGDTLLRLALKAMGHDLDEVADSGRRAGSGTFGAADGIKKAADEADAATQPVKSVADALLEAADAGRSLYDSQTSAAEAIAKATKQAKGNSAGLNENTAKGRENRQALSSLAGALSRNYQEYLKVNGAGAGATGVARRNYDAFVKAARGFGLSADAARNLANKILGIPSSRKTTANFNSGAARRDVDAYGNAIRGIPTYRRTTVEIAAKVTGSSASQSALNSALRKQNFSMGAGMTFAATSFMTAAAGSVGRTGGATPVNVNSDVTVLIDGKPVRAIVKEAINDERRRNAYTSGAGRRHG